MSPSDDREIKRLFEDVRDADERSSPRFEQIVAGARARRRTSQARRRAFALGAFGVVAGLVLGALSLRAPRSRSPANGEDRAPSLEQALTIASSAWVGPLDSLLDVPGTGLLASTPQFGGVPPAAPGAKGARP